MTSSPLFRELQDTWFVGTPPVPKVVLRKTRRILSNAGKSPTVAEYPALERKALEATVSRERLVEISRCDYRAYSGVLPPGRPAFISAKQLREIHMQARVLPLDKLIALAGLLPKARLIDNVYAAPPIADQGGCLKAASSLCYAPATHPRAWGQSIDGPSGTRVSQHSRSW